MAFFPEQRQNGGKKRQQPLISNCPHPEEQETFFRQFRMGMAGGVSGILLAVVLLVVAAIFLLLGFLWNKWHPGWVVFPVGGILCGIVSSLQRER